MMAIQAVTYKVSDIFDAITQWSDLNSLERQYSWTEPDGTGHVVNYITQNTLQEFLASYSGWKFTVMQLATDPTDTPAAAFAAFKEIWNEFIGRKSHGIGDAIEAYWKEYSYGADYQEDKTVTTTYGKTKDNKATAQQMADSRNGKTVSESFPAGTTFSFSSLSVGNGTDVEETNTSAAYDGTLKTDSKNKKDGTVSNTSGANTWTNETEGGTDTVHTDLSGTKGDIADKIRREVEFRIQTDVAWKIMQQFVYECLWFDGGCI